jgi:hypothetical protein
MINLIYVPHAKPALISGQMFSEQRFFAPRTLLRILQLFVGRGDQLPCHRRACNSASWPSRLPSGP